MASRLLNQQQGCKRTLCLLFYPLNTLGMHVFNVSHIQVNNLTIYWINKHLLDEYLRMF